MSSFLRQGAKVAKLEKGIYDNCKIVGVDIEQRKGNSGIINKLMYTKFAKYVDGKKKGEIELSWWKPDDSSTNFYNIQLQPMFEQVYKILLCFYKPSEIDSEFDNVFEGIDVTSAVDVQTRKWKKSELEQVYKRVSEIYKKALTARMSEVDLRLKVTTSFKGEGTEIPRFGEFVEPMSVEPSMLKFSNQELRNHSKAGNTETADNSMTSSNISI